MELNKFVYVLTEPYLWVILSTYCKTVDPFYVEPNWSFPFSSPTPALPTGTFRDNIYEL